MLINIITSGSLYIHSGISQWNPESPTESCVACLANNQFLGQSCSKYMCILHFNYILMLQHWGNYITIKCFKLRPHTQLHVKPLGSQICIRLAKKIATNRQFLIIDPSQRKRSKSMWQEFLDWLPNWLDLLANINHY